MPVNDREMIINEIKKLTRRKNESLRVPMSNLYSLATTYYNPARLCSFPARLCSFPARLCSGEDLLSWSSDQAKYKFTVYSVHSPPPQQGGVRVQLSPVLSCTTSTTTLPCVVGPPYIQGKK
jgi:hypothetical protein